MKDTKTPRDNSNTIYTLFIHTVRGHTHTHTRTLTHYNFIVGGTHWILRISFHHTHTPMLQRGNLDGKVRFIYLILDTHTQEVCIGE